MSADLHVGKQYTLDVPICRYTRPFQHYEGFLGKACDYSVVVFATFPEYHMDMANKVADKACPGQRFVLIVHNPGALESSGKQPEGIIRMLLGPALLMQHMHVPSLQHVPRCQPNSQLHLLPPLIQACLGSEERVWRSEPSARHETIFREVCTVVCLFDYAVTI